MDVAEGGLPATEPDTTAGRLQQLRDATGKSDDEIIADAVCRLYETVFGHASAQDPRDTEDLSHVLFRKLESNRPASILLRQGADMSFVLEEPFRYVGPDHGDGGATVEWIVPRREMTDLASVPEQLTWLVPRYGRHTLPALLHDYLQRDSAIEPPNAAVPACDDVTGALPVKPVVSSETADTIFREGMRSTGVPLVRRWLMWAAVSVRTIFNEGSDDAGAGTKLALVLWKALLAVCIAELALAGLLGLPWLVLQLAPLYAALTDVPVLGTILRAMQAIGDATLAVLDGPPVPVVVAALLLGPLVLGAAFGRRYRVGVLAGYSLLFVSFPLFFVALAGGVYRLAEAIAKLGQSHPNPVHTDTFRAQAADGGPGPEAGGDVATAGDSAA